MAPKLGIDDKEEDKYKAPLQEWRSTVAATRRQTITDKVVWLNRFGAEYRMFCDGTNVLRTRMRTGLLLNVNKQWQLSGYDELFVNAAGVNAGYVFDHNRTALGASYAFNTYLSAEAGYIYIVRKPLKTSDIVKKQNFCWQLNIQF